MKKLFCLMSLQIILIAAHSQEKPVKWGINGGLNLAKIKNIEDFSGGDANKTRIGLNVSAYAEISLGKNWFFQPGLGYSQLGAKSNEFLYYTYIITSNQQPSRPSALQTKFRSNYLILPLPLKYKLSTSGIGIFAGPQFGYLLNVKGDGGSQILSGNITDMFHKFDMEAICGAEYYVPLGVGISAQYQWGLTHISKTTQWFSPPPSLKNNAFAISIGYRF